MLRGRSRASVYLGVGHGGRITSKNVFDVGAITQTALEKVFEQVLTKEEIKEVFAENWAASAQ